jgi:hypothetical protein
MGSRIVVTITSGEQRVAVEIADGELRVVDAPAGSKPVTTGRDRNGLRVFLPRTPGGGDFAITADLHSEREPS